MSTNFTDLDLVDQLEDMARQHCFTGNGQYNGMNEPPITDSGGLSADAAALRTLAKHGRFRIVRERGRIVVGYWPEHEPQ